MKISIKNLLGGARCKSILYSSNEPFSRTTYEFYSSNAYGLISDFGRGAWALARTLGGKGDYDSSDTYCGCILLNDKIINTNEELQKYACFIGEISFENTEFLTARICIEKALEESKLPYSVKEIKELFLLSDGRFDRDLNYVSGEIWRISMAIGFALGKEIFCYPWFNQTNIRAYIDERNVQTLKDFNKIVIIPACRSAKHILRKKNCNHIVDMQKSERRLWMKRW